MLSELAADRHDRRHGAVIASVFTSGLTASPFRLRFRVCKFSLMPVILKSRRAAAAMPAPQVQSVDHAVTPNT